MLMNLFKRATYEVLASFFLLSILATVFSVSLNAALAHPQRLKDWLSQSGVYTQVVTNAINSAQTSDTSSADTTAISLKDPAVQKIARAEYSPQLVQENAEKFIDSNYAWLQGKNAAPDFKIDLSQTKDSFTQQVGKTVKDYLTALKPCTPEQLAQLQASGTISPLSIACRPANLDPQIEATRVMQQLSSGPFVDHSVITADSLGRDYGTTGNKPYYQTYSSAPTVYQAAQKLPYVLAFISILTMIGLISLATIRRNAVRRIGFIFLLAGILLLVVKFTGDFVTNIATQHALKNPNAGDLQQPISSFAHQMERALVTVDLYAGTAFLLIATLILIGLQISRGKRLPPTGQGGQREDTPFTHPVAPAPDYTPPVVTAPSPQPRPPRRRLIQ